MSEKKVGILHPVTYLASDLLPTAIPLPSTVLATPRVIWQWVADNQVSWLVASSDVTWRRCLGKAPCYAATPVHLGHLYYGDVYGFYAPSPDDLAMLCYAMDGRWWPEKCAVCQEGFEGYDDWGVPRCGAHMPTDSQHLQSALATPTRR